MLYIHIVEKKVEETEVSAAPGLPFMKDRVQSELPIDLINKFLLNLDDSMGQ